MAALRLNRSATRSFSSGLSRLCCSSGPLLVPRVCGLNEEFTTGTVRSGVSVFPSWSGSLQSFQDLPFFAFWKAHMSPNLAIDRTAFGGRSFRH